MIWVPLLLHVSPQPGLSPPRHFRIYRIFLIHRHPAVMAGVRIRNNFQSLAPPRTSFFWEFVSFPPLLAFPSWALPQILHCPKLLFSCVALASPTRIPPFRLRHIGGSTGHRPGNPSGGSYSSQPYLLNTLRHFLRAPASHFISPFPPLFERVKLSVGQPPEAFVCSCIWKTSHRDPRRF